MFVKLVSNGTWFVEGSEVWNYDRFERITLDEWIECIKTGVINCRGLRLCMHSSELHEIGDLYIDGETCNTDELYMTTTNDSKPFGR